MSGFQIPGLGQAKPNETLPPLPSKGVAATAASTEGVEMKDVESVPTKNEAKEISTDETKTADQPRQQQPQEHTTNTHDADSEMIDRPTSPPSITHALEATLGGLEPTPTTAQSQTTTTQPDQANGDLQPDASENPEWEVDSSPYESSSESSSSDSSNEDSDNEGYELLSVEETARRLMQAEGGSDDEGDKPGKGSSAAQLRTKNEVPEEVIPKPDLIVTPEMKIEELGAIEHIVETIMLIKAITPGEYQVLDTGSVLCNSERAVIGVVAETIGKVLQPMYTVRFNSEDEIKELGLEVGTKIFYPVDHASYVFTEPLKNLKGSDASNLHDEEVGDEEMEFSDDEKEAEYKRAIKQKKKDKWKNNNPQAKDREPHPLRQEVRPDGGLNYDDEDEDGPYKPLARPPGYGSGPVSTETYEHPTGRSFSRGGRRGDSRGRGGRGRGGPRGGGRGGFSQPRDGYSLPPQPQSLPQVLPQAQWPQPPAPHAGAAAPVMPSFGFQMPGWPSAVPPPPPGWPGSPGVPVPPQQTQQQQQPQQGQQAPLGGAFVNPAFFAALMSQMQGQNAQQPWGGQQPPQGGQGQ